MLRRALIITLLLATLPFMGLRCTLFPDPAQEATAQPVTLNYWRTFDDEDTMEGIIADYRRLHPNVTINYRKYRIEEYEKMLIDALAEDRGPDLFSIHNTWVPKYQSKISPMPDVMQVGYVVERGTIKKELVPEIRTINGYTRRTIEDTFVPAVANDVLLPSEDGKERVHALPLSVDTLALYYNRDLFNNAGIAFPPANWDDFEAAVKELKVIQNDTEVVNAAAAIGTATNIQRSGDIVSAIMQQNGTQMSSNGGATFERIPQGLSSRTVPPASDALRFYTNFGSPRKDFYTWNEEQPDSVEAFAQGRAAMMFGYAYHMQNLAAQAPALRYSVVPFPQIKTSGKARAVTSANYWVETVSKKSKNADMAWDFLMFATSQEEAKKYLTKTNKPTALRSLIAEQSASDTMRPFASQLLYATSWYRGRDPEGAEKAFETMILESLEAKTGSSDEEIYKIGEAIRRAVQKINEGW